ncbi:hypothetical protein DVDV_3381 [Desulfovibrio sp. DV]|nr:hypothetical protein DVDV_3381 [Desulfovibrio sp. DV]
MGPAAHPKGKKERQTTSGGRAMALPPLVVWRFERPSK